MIELIAEHSKDGVRIRGEYNGSHIISKPCKTALLSLIDWNAILFAFEDVDLWKELDFQLIHEYSEING